MSFGYFDYPGPLSIQDPETGARTLWYVGIQLRDFCQDKATGEYFTIAKILVGEEFDCLDTKGNKHLYRNCKVVRRVYS